MPSDPRFPAAQYDRWKDVPDEFPEIEPEQGLDPEDVEYDRAHDREFDFEPEG